MALPLRHMKDKNCSTGFVDTNIYIRALPRTLAMFCRRQACPDMSRLPPLIVAKRPRQPRRFRACMPRRHAFPSVVVAFAFILPSSSSSRARHAVARRPKKDNSRQRRIFFRQCFSVCRVSGRRLAFSAAHTLPLFNLKTLFCRFAFD